MTKQLYDKLLAALEFYANEANYQEKPHPVYPEFEVTTEVQLDVGARARLLLDLLENKDNL